MGFVAHDLGVDLGTSNTLVYVKHKGIMISEDVYKRQSWSRARTRR